MSIADERLRSPHVATSHVDNGKLPFKRPPTISFYTNISIDIPQCSSSSFRSLQMYGKEEEEKHWGRKLGWKPDEWSWYYSPGLSWTGPARETATAVTERGQRPSLPKLSDLDLDKECHQLPTRSDQENVCWLRGKKRGWRSDELSRLSWTGRPTDLHWCTDAATLTIYIHSRWSQHH
jgi:hypothetical protein